MFCVPKPHKSPTKLAQLVLLRETRHLVQSEQVIAVVGWCCISCKMILIICPSCSCECCGLSTQTAVQYANLKGVFLEHLVSHPHPLPFRNRTVLPSYTSFSQTYKCIKKPTEIINENKHRKKCVFLHRCLNWQHC